MPVFKYWLTQANLCKHDRPAEIFEDATETELIAGSSVAPFVPVTEIGGVVSAAAADSPLPAANRHIKVRLALSNTRTHAHTHLTYTRLAPTHTNEDTHLYTLLENHRDTPHLLLRPL